LVVLVAVRVTVVAIEAVEAVPCNEPVNDVAVIVPLALILFDAVMLTS
jgi:hypothetical protein